jgi:isopentenyldiphosphate isomerase/NTP pyrophosphatase (non-canonical NTP hydrolase)
MKEFDEFDELITKSMDLDSWIRDAGVEGYVKHLNEEAKEVLEATEKREYTNLKDELGDILSCWLILCKLGEEHKLFSASEVITGAIEKAKRRRPYVLEGKKVSKEEAYRIWQDVKLKEKEQQTEFVDEVDENDNVLRAVSHNEMRKHKLLHRVSIILVRNAHNEMLVQKRSADKAVFPGYFALGAGGCVKSKETYHDAAVRELKEELGIDDKNISFLFSFKYLKDNPALFQVFECRYDGPITIQKEELSGFFWINADSVKELMAANKFPPDDYITFEKWQKMNQ